MPPMMMTSSIRPQTESLKVRSSSLVLARSLRVSVSLPARHQTANASRKASINPGTTPAMNMRPTDSSVTAA